MRQRVAERIRAARQNRKPITKDSTKEEIEAFQRRVHEGEAVFKRQFEIERLDAAEKRYVRLLRKYHREASWIMLMKQFPDGGCQREQTSWELSLWSLFIGALQGQGSADFDM